MNSTLNLLIGLAMGLNLLALASSRLPSVINAAAVQGIVLGLLPLLLEGEFHWLVGLVAMSAIHLIVYRCPACGRCLGGRRLRRFAVCPECGVQLV